MSTQVHTAHGNHTCDVIVVGGGISGLATAWFLHNAGVDVHLIEAQPRVGGAMETERRAGFLLEKGPFNVMVRCKEFEALLEGLQQRVQVVTASDEAKNRYIYRHGALRKVPTGPLSLLTTDLLSKPAALRALRGLFISARGKEPETTLGEFAARRFGPEVAETLVSAAIAGILAGDIDKLSAYAAFPALEDFDRKSLSPLGRTARRIPTMIAKRRNPALRRRWKGLVSIDEGLGGLCAAIAADLGERCIVNTRVEAIEPTEDGFALGGHTGDNVRTLLCRRLVLATPLATAANLIEPLIPAASRNLRTIDSASLTVVNLGFRRDDVAHPLDGFGFLVPRNEPDFPLMGVLWADSAFPHHAPADKRLLRCFLGGTRTPDIIDHDADTIVRTACRTLRDTLGVRGEPVLVDVCPYPNAIPQYYLGHREKISDIRAHVAQVPNLTLAGNYLEGVSINDCIKLAKRVAEALCDTKQPVPA